MGKNPAYDQLLVEWEILCQGIKVCAGWWGRCSVSYLSCCNECTCALGPSHTCAVYTHKLNKSLCSCWPHRGSYRPSLVPRPAVGFQDQQKEHGLGYASSMYLSGGIGVCLLLVFENRIISEILSQANVLAHSERKCLCVTTRFSLFLLHLLASGKTCGFITCKRADSDWTLGSGSSPFWCPHIFIL